ALIGSEALAVARRELFEPRHHGGDAAGPCVVEWAAAEGGEAGPEQHRRIDEIGGFHYALAQTRDTLVHHHENQPIDEIGRCARVRSGRLDGLALPPQVETLAALATEFLGCEQLVEPRDLGHRSSELLRDDLADVRSDIEPDHIDELDGTDGHAEAHRAAVDGFGRGSLLCGEHRLVQVRCQYAVHHEAGCAAA